MKRNQVLTVLSAATVFVTSTPANAIASCDVHKDVFSAKALCSGPGTYHYHVVVRCVSSAGAVTYETGNEVGKNQWSSRTCNNGIASWANAVVTNFS